MAWTRFGDARGAALDLLHQVADLEGMREMRDHVAKAVVVETSPPACAAFRGRSRHPPAPAPGCGLPRRGASPARSRFLFAVAALQRIEGLRRMSGLPVAFEPGEKGAVSAVDRSRLSRCRRGAAHCRDRLLQIDGRVSHGGRRDCSARAPARRTAFRARSASRAAGRSRVVSRMRSDITPTRRPPSAGRRSSISGKSDTLRNAATVVGAHGARVVSGKCFSREYGSIPVDLPGARGIDAAVVGDLVPRWLHDLAFEDHHHAVGQPSPPPLIDLAGLGNAPTSIREPASRGPPAARSAKTGCCEAAFEVIGQTVRAPSMSDLCQIVVHELDGDGALADAGRHAFDGAVADIAHREDARRRWFRAGPDRAPRSSRAGVCRRASGPGRSG